MTITLNSLSQKIWLDLKYQSAKSIELLFDSSKLTIANKLNCNRDTLIKMKLLLEFVGPNNLTNKKLF